LIRRAAEATTVMVMTITDYILDITLIAIVFRQLRESRLGWHAIAIPLAVCGYVGVHYLHSMPTAGNDLALVALFTGIGVVLGLVSALTTRVRRNAEGHALVKAGWVAAGAWVLGMGFRFGFSLWTSHGGDASLARFSMRHDITSGAAWTDALVLMAFGEVFVRTAILVLRAHRASSVAAAEPQRALAAA